MSGLISRQAAIDAIAKTARENFNLSDEYNQYLAALFDAEKEIRDLPSAQPEPCEDAQHILDYLDNVLHPLVSPEHWNVYSELHDMIAALPPAQPENVDCIYCHEDSDGYVKPIEKNGHAFIRFGMNGWEISLGAKGWNGSAKIMYCPMCGRRFVDG